MIIISLVISLIILLLIEVAGISCETAANPRSRIPHDPESQVQEFGGLPCLGESKPSKIMNHLVWSNPHFPDSFSAGWACRLPLQTWTLLGHGC